MPLLVCKFFQKTDQIIINISLSELIIPSQYSPVDTVPENDANFANKWWCAVEFRTANYFCVPFFFPVFMSK
ncbi:hypothetical protein ACH3XW_22440 [Acanthocheilonema viteae]